MIPWLEGDAPFPPVASALRRPNGLLCAGGDLSPQRLRNAYRLSVIPMHANDSRGIRCVQDLAP